MMYSHFSQPEGNIIMKNLAKIRENMGAAWSENMAAYAIRKGWRIPPLKWSEPVHGLNYHNLQFVEV